MIINKKPEVLAPAGDFERLYAAVEYGADKLILFCKSSKCAVCDEFICDFIDLIAKVGACTAANTVFFFVYCEKNEIAVRKEVLMQIKKQLENK